MQKLYLFFYIFFFAAHAYDYPLLIDFSSISSGNSMEKYIEKNLLRRSFNLKNPIQSDRYSFNSLKKQPMDFYNNYSQYPTVTKKGYNNLIKREKTLQETLFKRDSGWFYYKKWKVDSGFPSDLSLYYFLNKNWSTALTYLNLSKRNPSSPQYVQEAEDFHIFFKTPANGLDWGFYLTSRSFLIGLFAGMNIGISCGIGYQSEIASFEIDTNLVPYGGIRASFHF